MFKRNTLILLSSAVVLTGGVLLLEHYQSQSSSSPNAAESASVAGTAGSQIGSQAGSEKPLLPFAEQTVTSVTVVRPENTLSFTKSSNGTWEMSQPEQGPAEEGAIAFLLSQLTDPVTHRLTVDTANLGQFGLESPAATLSIIADGKPYRLAIGDTDFSGDRRYVRLLDTSQKMAEEMAEGTAEPSAEQTEAPEAAPQAAEAPESKGDSTEDSTVEIYVVSGSISSAVNRPTAEWRLVETPAPSQSQPTQQPLQAPADGTP